MNYVAVTMLNHICRVKSLGIFKVTANKTLISVFHLP